MGPFKATWPLIAVLFVIPLLVRAVSTSVTTVSPARSPIFRETDRDEPAEQHPVGDTEEEDYAEVEGMRVMCRPPKGLKLNTSAKATEMLLKDLKKLLTSDGYKRGEFSVKLLDDSIYCWRITLLNFPKPDTILVQGLKELKEMGLEDEVVVDFIFDDRTAYKRFRDIKVEQKFVHPVMSHQLFDGKGRSYYQIIESCPYIHLAGDDEHLSVEVKIPLIKQYLTEHNPRVLVDATKRRMREIKQFGWQTLHGFWR